MDASIQSDLGCAALASEDLATRRAELRRECEATVVDWRWAREGSDLQRPEPLYHQRHGLPKPALLAYAPATPQTEQQYGIDADGNIVIAREYVGPGSFREELRVRRGDTVVGYRWSEDGDPLEVNVARFADGRLRSYVTVWPEGRPDSLRGSSIERYAYDGELVSEIHDETLDALADEPPERSLTRIQASYDPTGRLLELREHAADGERVRFRARGTGPSPEALQRRVEDRLVEMLPKLVHERAGDEPIYCLVLHYHSEWPMPPTVGVGLERERLAWIDSIEDVQTLRMTVWNPAEFGNYRDGTVAWDLSAIDPELARALRAIPDSESAAEQARATLNRAARRLQELDWSSIASVTDDFVVVAVDHELTHLQDNFRHSVPAAVRKTLSGRALI